MLEIPGYSLIKLLGRGGMAEVYLAEQISLQRKVAIKIIQDPKDPAFRERFQVEARTNARLSHPHIVTIHDFGSLQGNNYIVMELLRGGELRQRLAKGMSLRQILAAIRDVAKALGYAHRQGVVHRDVTSANVMFRGDGQAVLTDFGIAKLFGKSNPKMTGTGLMIGTPNYMSPEQIRGEPVDGRSDIYSLGIVLWEALTGATPFHSDSTITTCMRHLNEPLPQLPQLVGPVGDVVYRMLAKTPAERYQAAEEVALALNTALQRLPAGADDPGATVRLHRAKVNAASKAAAGNVAASQPQPMPVMKPRRRAPWLVAAALAVTAALGAGGWWYYGMQRTQQLRAVHGEVMALRQKVAAEEEQYYKWQQAQHAALVALEEKLQVTTEPQEQQRLRREISLARADEAQLGTEELIAAELVFSHADEDRLAELGDDVAAIAAAGDIDGATRTLSEIRDNYRKSLKVLAALEKLRADRHRALAARLAWERERIVAQQPEIPMEHNLSAIAEKAHQLLEDAKLDDALKAFNEVGREYGKLLKSAQYAWQARSEAQQAQRSWLERNIASQETATPEAQMREGETALSAGHWARATNAFVVAKEQFSTLSSQAAGNG